MTDITYTYTIEEVDTDLATMVVKYEAAGHQTISISMRLPFDGEETLEDVVRAFSPIQWWNEKSKTRVSVAKGDQASVTVDAETGLKASEISQPEAPADPDAPVVE